MYVQVKRRERYSQMSKFEKDARALLDYVGGASNINAVTHCVTRMRFVLADPSLADIDAIEDLPSAKGTFTQSGQFQVIIGNEVQEFYNDFLKVSGLEGVSKEAVKSEAKSQQTWLQRLMSNLGEIFAPLIPALITGGLILGFRNIIDSVYMFENGTKTLVMMNQFWAGLDSFLWLIGEAIFHFLPVGITWSITKKMGTTQILGIVLGITLVSPQLLNAYAVASTPAAEIPVWDCGFAQIQMIGYQAQVIPAILAGFALVYIERFFRKITPSVISMIVVPFCSLILAVLLAHAVLGPIGWVIGDWISDIVWAGLTSNVKWLFAAIFGFVYAPLVITGLHHMTNAIDTQLVSSFGGTTLWPMIALSNIAQGSSVLAMSVLQKHNDKAEQINIPSMISCYLGVTEPALFGVNLKYGFPFICGMIGSSVAAMISVGFGVTAANIGVGGIPGILSIFPQFWGWFQLAMAAAIVIPFVLTWIIGLKKLNAEDRYGKKKAAKAEETAAAAAKSLDMAEDVFLTPAEGTVLPLEKVEDQVFSQKMMGDGYAIDVTGKTISSPVNGTIMMTFPTGHAVGLKDTKGREILIHIGMDTVELDGKGFTVLVKPGDVIQAGDPLVNIDPEVIRAAGKSLVSPVIVTSGQKVVLEKEGPVSTGEKAARIED